MAKRSTTQPSSSSPSIPPEKAIELLGHQQDEGRQLLDNPPLSASEHRKWETVTRDYLIRSFGSQSGHDNAVMNIGHPRKVPLGASVEWVERRRAQILAEQLRLIDGLVELLRTDIELGSPSPQTAETQPTGNHVFIAHGHNEAVLHQTARFLEKLQLPVIILREQPNKGRTIIEKFVDYSDVAFAVVLLTADDYCGDPAIAETRGMKPKARQNVILELGFFLGKLGRERVCALYEDGVDIPSDYSGVLFVLLDKGGAWRLQLARELKAAGLEVDMNLAV